MLGYRNGRGSSAGLIRCDHHTACRLWPGNTIPVSVTLREARVRKIASAAFLRCVRNAICAIAHFALRTFPCSSRIGWWSSAEPPCFHNPDAAIRAYERAVSTGGSRAYTNEHPQVVVKAIHFRNLTGLQSIAVGNSDLGWRVERRAGRLNRDYKFWLLSKPGNHRNLIWVHGSYGNAAALRAPRKCSGPWLHGQRKPGNLRQVQASANGVGNAELMDRINRQQIHGHAKRVDLPSAGYNFIFDVRPLPWPLYGAAVNEEFHEADWRGFNEKLTVNVTRRSGARGKTGTHLSRDILQVRADSGTGDRVVAVIEDYSFDHSRGGLTGSPTR